MGRKPWQSKITQSACDRCAAHTMQDQLIAHAEELLNVKQARLNGNDDMEAVNTAFIGDTSWPADNKQSIGNN